ncbi:MAG TPA: hypothetical protein VJ302_22680, partial [Blastocatellia bacterium]|nr:hypothetical protein [Blastocatellia bacterium]
MLNNVPTPYFKPLFERLAQAPGWQLTVCYSSAWNRDVGWRMQPLDRSERPRTIILDQKSPQL